MSISICFNKNQEGYQTWCQIKPIYKLIQDLVTSKVILLTWRLPTSPFRNISQNWYNYIFDGENRVFFHRLFADKQTNFVYKFVKKKMLAFRFPFLPLPYTWICPSLLTEKTNTRLAMSVKKSVSRIPMTRNQSKPARLIVVRQRYRASTPAAHRATTNTKNHALQAWLSATQSVVGVIMDDRGNTQVILILRVRE